MYVIEQQMPYTELLKWIEFFRRRPIGWREDQRVFTLLRAQGVKGSPESIFPTLRILKESEEKAKRPDRAKPKGKFLEMMMKARGSESPEVLQKILGTNDDSNISRDSQLRQGDEKG